MSEIMNIEDKKKKEAESADVVKASGDIVVELSRTYKFEGEDVSSIDFSGLEDVNAETMIKANKTLTTSGDVSVLPENSLHYALVIAAGCTAYPIEFYKTLKPRDAIKVKNTVTNFFYGEE